MQVSYNMIYVYANSGDHQEVEKLFQAMQKQGCLPHSFMYLSLVQAYTESLNYSKAEETIQVMQSMKGIPPSCTHFNILLFAFTMMKGYLKYRCMEEGINFFERICKSSKGDKFIMSAATVHLYKSAGMENQAKEILSSMNKMRIPFCLKLGRQRE